MNAPGSDGDAVSESVSRHVARTVFTILLVGLVISISAALYLKWDADEDARRDSDFVCNEIKTRIQDRMRAHEQILHSGVAFFEQTGEVTRQEWREFVERQKVSQHHPGIQGVGFSLLIPHDSLAQHIERIRADGFPEYQVRPEGNREIYSSIIYLEPFASRNLRAFGYDMLSEPVRRAALERARDGDSAALSGKVVLVQETDKDVQAGALMSVPVYRKGMPIGTVDQRRQALLGWVYSPYRINDLMRGILGGWDLDGQKRVHLEIFDTATPSPENLLYNSQSGGLASGQLPERFTLESRINLAGRPWTLRFTREQVKWYSLDYSKAWMVLFGGASITALLSALVNSLMNTRAKALQMAKTLTGELSQSEARFATFFRANLIPSAISRVDDGRFVEVNDAFLKMYGYERDEILGRNALQLGLWALPDDRERAISQLMEKGSIRELESKFRKKNGELGNVLVSAGFVEIEGVRHMLGMLLDVTERKKAEEMLRQSESKFRSILETSPVPTAINDDQGNITYLNFAFTRVFGYDIRDIPTLNDWWPKAYPDPTYRSKIAIEWQQHLERIRFKGTSSDPMEVTVRCKDDQDRTVLVRATDLSPSVKGFHLVVLYDITDRRRIEEALREREENLELALDGADLGTWDWDVPSGKVTFSERWASMLGYSLNEIEPHVQSWKNLVHPDDVPHVTAQLTAHLEGRSAFYEAEHRLRHKSGEWIWVLDKGKVIIRSDQGSPIRVCGTHLDITLRKRAEEDKERLEDQNRQLQRSESLGRMAGAIAHHFNNKLQAVMMSLNLIELARVRGISFSDVLSNAMEAARNASEVSSLMLTYLGQSQTCQELLDLSEACLNALSLLRTVFPQNVVFQTEWPTPGPVIKADKSQLQQILANLLANAWEAVGQEPGTIRLSIKPVAAADIPSRHRFPVDWKPELNCGYACLQIEDTGCGIPPEHFDKLFEPFFTTKFTGRGLGLSSVLGIVRSHNGVITVESHQKRGSVFRVFLPAAAVGLPVRPVSPIPASAAPTNGVVLVVDDDISVLKMVSAALVSLGYNVLKAENGQEAIKVFQQHKDTIACVLTDLTMPVMDGWKVLEAVRTHKPGIRVILTSGYSAAQVLEGDHPVLPNALLSKPYEIGHLKETLNRIMAQAVED